MPGFRPAPITAIAEEDRSMFKVLGSTEEDRSMFNVLCSMFKVLGSTEEELCSRFNVPGSRFCVPGSAFLGDVLVVIGVSLMSFKY